MTLEKILLLLAIAAAYFIAKNTIHRVVNRIGLERNIAPARVQYVKAAITVAWTAVAITAVGMVVGVGYDELGIFLGSALALFGVALFAQWSILSNITASVIVFFFFPYRVGHYVEILDGENTVNGRIKEITLFHVILEGENNVIITYPNTLVFQRAVKITPPEAGEK